MTKLEEYQMVVHLFGAVSSPSVANFALRKTALDNKQEYDNVVVNTVLRNFYVDNCLKSLPTDEDALLHSKELTTLLMKGGFHLTKWVNLVTIVEQSKPLPRPKETRTSKNLT